ncbi:hypothetical protein Droror1_Dr00020088 [Drosera rotundifolia]
MEAGAEARAGARAEAGMEAGAEAGAGARAEAGMETGVEARVGERADARAFDGLNHFFHVLDEPTALMEEDVDSNDD